MTTLEAASVALRACVAALPLALAAVYAILGDKFIRPPIERAESTTARLRGRLSALIAESVRPLVGTVEQDVAQVALLGQNGAPLEAAAISRPNPINSEGFKDAIRDRLTTQSAELDDYLYATSLTRRLKFIFSIIRIAICTWPVVTLSAIAYFWIVKSGFSTLPSTNVLLTLTLLAMLPIAIVVVLLPAVAHFASCVDKLDR